MSDVVNNIAAMSPEKRELLLRRLGKKKAERVGTSKQPTISARARNAAPIPLSFTQQRLWFIHQLDPNSHAYNIPRSLRLKGRLNLPALEKSLNEIVRRHEILRTSYSTVDGQPVQVISSSLELALPKMDLRAFPETERLDEACRMAAELAVLPFDMSRGPLIRTYVIKLDDQDHLLLVIMHHVVTDVWSLGLFFREMAALYEAFIKGAASPLPLLSVQYADYAIWQREHMQGEVLESRISYWKKQLGGKLPVLQLPSVRPRPAALTFRGYEVAFVLDRGLTRNLKTLSQREGATLFMTLLAAFKVLLFRYSGQTDLIIGSPMASRTPIETERLIGFFANTVVFRTAWEGDPSFSTLLKLVRETALGAYAHQDLPFEKLVEALQPERSPSHTVLFQALFALQNTAIPDLKLPDLEVELVGIDSGNSRFDVSLHFTEWPDGLKGLLEYSTDLFDSTTISRMIGHFRTLLHAIVTDPNRPVSALPMLTEPEERMIVEWNSTQIEFSSRVLLNHLIESQVERTPDSSAVVFSDQAVCYQEFNRRSNQLAHRLRKLGVGPDIPVIIVMERSLEMVTAIVGVLKAGGAYVPIDPLYPPDRIAFMLEDIRTPVVLTQRAAARYLPRDLPHVVYMEYGWSGPEADENPCVQVEADNLAYIIYTSGSTGKPKGVMSSHRGLRNRLLWMQQAYGLTQSDSVLQKTPFTFDVSVWEFLWPLITGARLVVAEPGGHQDTSYLAELIGSERITTLHFVPSMLRVFLEEEGLDSLTSVRQVMSSGEALPPELPRAFRNRFGAELNNLYGPTEASIDVTYYPCAEFVEPGGVPIGRPISNTQIHILDSGLLSTPIIVPGELHIGGDGLARGYLDRPDLTAERFVPSPADGEPGARLYKTGDLARWLDSGNVEYLGRLDYQIKLRGFRIELGEIEAALAHHPGVREAVVVARPDRQGETRLIAYTVARVQPAPSTAEMQEFLREKTPAHMVPSAFVALESLPLTTSGKIDRKALPASEATGLSKKAFVPPRSTTEIAIAEMWSELLGVKEIGIEDDFFDVGGHSLLGIQLMWKLRRRFGRSVPVTTLFAKRTIAELAALIEEGSEVATNEVLVPIKAGAGAPLFCIHPAGGHVMVYRDLAAALNSNAPVYGLQSRATDDPTSEHESIDEMARSYAEAITKAQPAGPYHLAGWSMGGVVALSIAKKLEERGHRIAFVALIDSYLRQAGSSAQPNPLEGLGLAFGGVMAGAFREMDESERQSLLDEFILLAPAERVRRAIAWGRHRGLLSESLAPEMLEQQIKLSETHLDLLSAHSAPIVTAPLFIWWAKDNLREGRSRTDWASHSRGEARIDELEANHFTALRRPNCERIAARIGELMELQS